MHRILLLLAFATLTGCASTPNDATHSASTPAAISAPVATTPPPRPFLETTLQADRVAIGGQPAAVDLATLKASGYSHVFNLRSDDEMKALGYDEAAVARESGLGYTHAPIASGAAYTPAVLEAFAKSLERTDGKVLLHCASGGRAGHLYAAYLVKYEGSSPDDAMRIVADFGVWPLPMERLLGEPLRLERAQQ